ncbi:hypothetical protein [Kitasatospora sp. GP82]|uniref:hypothetical protein n=1 Tax=Kitasatospora sp. GP82 TaxID=3035089 RepID=UPI0024763D9F|nr:hypothetical protein [Kitasatospora sp. GP82]MDH6129835.1 hypothetical protein [Kitasatospora sp. GP82]
MIVTVVQGARTALRALRAPGKGEHLKLEHGKPVSHPTPVPVAPSERCTQPPGREPARRQPQAGLRIGVVEHLPAE